MAMGFYVGTNLILGGEARRQGKPLVYHAHGFFEPWILNRSRWKKQLAHWLFENANFRQVKLWRALTSKEASQIRAQGIKAPVVIVPNGLDLDDYSRPKREQVSIQTPWIPVRPGQKTPPVIVSGENPIRRKDWICCSRPGRVWAAFRRAGSWSLPARMKKAI